MKVKRLQHLRKLMLATPPTRFDMNYWGRDEEPCGTTCCALGTAALDPEFVQQGLVGTWHGPKGNKSLEVLFGDEEGTDAGAKFFGISDEKATYLFMPSAYATYCYGENRVKPDDVVRHIDNLLLGLELER